MNSCLAGLLAVLATPALCGATAVPTALLAKPIKADPVAGYPACDGTDQIQYRVTFTVSRVEAGKPQGARATAIVCSHQKAAIFEPAAYLLVKRQGQAAFDAYPAHLIACSVGVEIPDKPHYRLRASGPAASPGEGSDCILF